MTEIILGRKLSEVPPPQFRGRKTHKQRPLHQVSLILASQSVIHGSSTKDTPELGMQALTLGLQSTVRILIKSQPMHTHPEMCKSRFEKFFTIRKLIKFTILKDNDFRNVSRTVQL